jgi:hypothetical protein
MSNEIISNVGVTESDTSKKIANNKQNTTNEREKNTFRNLDTSMLVSATYDGKKNVAVLKFYNPKTQ